MRRAGRPSWQISVDHPQVLAVALYVRDVAGIRQVAQPADLPEVEPPVARAGDDPATAEATAEWNAWWTCALATGPGAAMELQPPAFPAFAGAPALHRLLEEHFHDARRWSEAPRRQHAEYMMSSSPPLGRWVDEVERALGRPADPFTLRIDEVPVTGDTWRPVSDSHVLVSPALLRNQALLHTRLRPVLERLA